MGNIIVETVSALTTSSQQLGPDILLLEFTIVNVCVLGDPRSGSGEWVLVDTGLENSAQFILDSTEKKYGQGKPPQAIILTHGHFDHVGSVITLADKWDVPVYIHSLEMPYVTGKKDYPVADSKVRPGLVAKISPTFPNQGIDLGYRAVKLPDDGSIPGFAEWKWIHTPGHTEGHVALFREKDGVLIAGDAFSTVKQESLLSVLTQKEQISGPPQYLTVDWTLAEDSVNRLKDLRPSLAIPSHGRPMSGEELNSHLEILTNHFKEIAKPAEGRFVGS